MTDGQRDWEIQLPEIATAYEVKVPMSGKGTGMRADMAPLTAADREILAERDASARAEQLGDGEPSRTTQWKETGRARQAGRRTKTTTTTAWKRRMAKTPSRPRQAEPG